MPGSSPTIARREPVSRLNSVDLPTFGRPTMARVKGFTAVWVDEVMKDTTQLFIIETSVASTSQPVVPARKQEISLYQFFGPGGILSRTHPAYEFRRGQLQM